MEGRRKGPFFVGMGGMESKLGWRVGFNPHSPNTFTICFQTEHLKTFQKLERKLREEEKITKEKINKSK